MDDMVLLLKEYRKKHKPVHRERDVLLFEFLQEKKKTFGVSSIYECAYLILSNKTVIPMCPCGKAKCTLFGKKYVCDTLCAVCRKEVIKKQRIKKGIATKARRATKRAEERKAAWAKRQTKHE